MTSDEYTYGYDRTATASVEGLIHLIGLENLPDEKVELNGVMVNAKTMATHVTLEGGLLSTATAEDLKHWVINFL